MQRSTMIPDSPSAPPPSPSPTPTPTPSPSTSSYWTQANALLRKNLTFQKRNIWTNVRLVLFPVVLCTLLALLQMAVYNLTVNPPSSNKCGKQNSTLILDPSCPIPHPQEWPPLLQIPAPQYRSVRTDYISAKDLPDGSCKKTGSCPAIMFVTGNNQTFAQRVAGNMFADPLNTNLSDILYNLADNALGSETIPEGNSYNDPAFLSDVPIQFLQPKCSPDSDFYGPPELGPVTAQEGVRCVEGLQLWRNSSSEISDLVYKGYRLGNPDGRINEIVAAYDFMNSDGSTLNVTIWHNFTYENDDITLTRVPRSVNLVSNAFLEFVLGPGAKIPFEFVKETPRPEISIGLDVTSALEPLFFTWVILQLFQVILTTLVYEKQQKLRIMMKMHGLGDGPYLLITYGYFLAISAMYMLCFAAYGAVVGLKFFRLNEFSLQFVFYFLFINMQISLAFLAANFFSNVKTATGVGSILVFGTALLGGILFNYLLQSSSTPETAIVAMELYPGFALYRGIYELAQYANGMKWKNLNDAGNGMKVALIIIGVEWLVVLAVSYFVNLMLSTGTSPLSFLQRDRQPELQRNQSTRADPMDKPDVSQEREKVEQLLLDSSGPRQGIICHHLKKTYPGTDGNPQKYAVRELSLGVPQGECFGLLGPNGAGKSTSISMMIGRIKPSSGTAHVRGLDIRKDMAKIYTSMGVCPQHDLLWETLTGREHLLFYGRLKNLKGAVLKQAVEDSLMSMNLFGVADKQAGKYSGGMKRRLTVAISLIGNPKVVYLDEPSTGLDPASRRTLWNAIQQTKQDKAIILTTHSMEEAEYLCDRLGIFVNGQLQCIGNSRELKARYGGSYVFSMTAPNHDREVEDLVRRISPKATKIYHISGTQKFDLPKGEIILADVFNAVEDAKRRFVVQAWGISDTTLEDVFIKVAQEAQPNINLS